MKRKYHIIIEGETVSFPEHTTFRQIVDRYADRPEDPVVMVRLNGNPQELFKEVTQDGTLEFVQMSSKDGMQVYLRSALFVMQKAFHDVSQDANRMIRVLFTMDHAYYCEVFRDGEQQRLCASEASLLHSRMEELIEADLPIRKENVSAREAEAVFAEHNLKDQNRLFAYRRSSRVNLYSINGYREYQYGFLLDHTGLLRRFELLMHEPTGGFFLNFPAMEDPDAVDPFVFQPKLFSLQRRDSIWASQLDLATVGALNDRIAQGGMGSTILAQEAMQEQAIGEIAQNIISSGDKKFILIAGPSSSGKTTFSHRLSIQLLSRGYHPHAIAMDDFFLDRDKMIRQSDGSFDFESLDAVNVVQFNEIMLRLLNGEEVQMPKFDFREGRQKFDGRTLKIGPDDILVIEGIHGLNPKVSASLPAERIYRIYISALSPLKMDEHNCLSTRDMRLLRRIVRDARTRGTDAARTLSMWDSVRRGEERHIFPFQENADVMFNSSLIYELPVMKQYVEPALFSIPKSDPAYPEAGRLLKLLSHSLGYPSEGIASHSILREFIGGSCFSV